MKRSPRGFDDDHPLIDDLKRKDFIGVSELPEIVIHDDQFTKHVATAFGASKPLMRFLCQAVDVPF